MNTIFGFLSGTWARAGPASNIGAAAIMPNPREPIRKARGVMAKPSVPHSGQSGVRLLKRKHAFPVILHVHHGPSVYGSGVQGLVELAKVRLAIIGVFPFRIGMMDDQA